MATRVVKALKEAAESAETEIQRLEKELERLRAVKQGLDYAIEREQRPKPRPNLPTKAEGDWGEISKIAAVERVLEGATSPMSPTEIAQELNRRGRDDTAGGVSASLSRLKRERRAIQAGYSKWTAARLGVGAPLPEPIAARDQERPDGGAA